MPAGAEIGAGKAHKGESGAICPAADRHNDRLDAGLLHGGLGAMDDFHMGEDFLLHICIAIYHGDIKGSLAVLLV